MSDIQKLDEAFLRFEAALSRVEQAVGNQFDGFARVAALENEAESLKRERARLAHELELVRSKAGELADTSKTAAGKIDAAMSRIRAVLHSNTPG